MRNYFRLALRAPIAVLSFFSTLAMADTVVTHGPMIGALTPTSTTVWARWSRPSMTHVEYGEANGFELRSTETAQVDSSTDTTAKISIEGLIPGTVYRYRLVSEETTGTLSISQDYFFRTPALQPTHLSFVVLSDFMTALKASKSLTQATKSKPDFAAIIGDLDHRDPASPPGGKAEYYPASEYETVLQNMRTMRRDIFDPRTKIGSNFSQSFTVSTDVSKPQIPLYYSWDDHDFCVNNSDSECPFVTQAFQVYTENFSSAASNGLDGLSSCGKGIWQSFSYGALASVFMLDSRSNRTASSESMLGPCQKQWLFDGLSSSTSKWKFVISPVPFNPGTKLDDAWAQFPAERAELVDFIRSHGIHDVIILSGDIHSGGALDDGTNSDFPEASVPHANMPSYWTNTYCHQMTGGQKLCTPGTWTLGGLFDNSQGVSSSPPPAPLNGVNSPGYLRVDVSDASVSLQIMDQAGRLKRGIRANGSGADMRLDLQPWSQQQAQRPGSN